LAAQDTVAPFIVANDRPRRTVKVHSTPEDLLEKKRRVAAAMPPTIMSISRSLNGEISFAIQIPENINTRREVLAVSR